MRCLVVALPQTSGRAKEKAYRVYRGFGAEKSGGSFCVLGHDEQRVERSFEAGLVVARQNKRCVRGRLDIHFVLECVHLLDVRFILPLARTRQRRQTAYRTIYRQLIGPTTVVDRMPMSKG